MIRLDHKQGSPEWTRARLGIPTASQFHRILTPKTMKLGAGAETYLCELIAEQLLGLPSDQFVSEWMERGTGLEASAVDFYEFQRELETEEVGHILTDDRRAGCSPDRLVGADGGLEIKCPSPAVHVAYALAYGRDDEIPAKFKAQIQGALWITEREWWDFLSFNPEMRPVLKRSHRDDAFIDTLASAVGKFCDRLDAARDQLIARGFTFIHESTEERNGEPA